MKFNYGDKSIRNLASAMKSVNPSVYVPPSNDELFMAALNETMAMYQGSKTGEVIRQLMLGILPHDICQALGIDKRQLEMSLGYFYLDVQTAYKRRMPKKQLNLMRKNKGWW